MTESSDKPASWMAYKLPLNEEFRLEHAFHEESAHCDMAKVRDLCASLMRLNYHQQQLLSKAIGRIGELELVLFLGASAEPDETDAFLAMAREVCQDLGIG